MVKNVNYTKFWVGYLKNVILCRKKRKTMQREERHKA